MGFAAETESLIDNACRKRLLKKCDWIVANDVASATVFGSERNTVHLITEDGITCFPTMTKVEIAESLTERIIVALTENGVQRSLKD